LRVGDDARRPTNEPRGDDDEERAGRLLADRVQRWNFVRRLVFFSEKQQVRIERSEPRGVGTPKNHAFSGMGRREPPRDGR
jgi:hypothetical protein